MADEEKAPAKAKRTRARKRAPARPRAKVEAETEVRVIGGPPRLQKCIVRNDGTPSQINLPDRKPLMLAPHEEATVDLDSATIAKIQVWLGLTAVRVIGKAG